MKSADHEEPVEADEPEEFRGKKPAQAGEEDLAVLARERDEYLASWKRATADYQNLRRRLQSDIDAAVAREKAALLGDLLLVLDYLDMALATPVATTEGKTLQAGVLATRTALLGALEREGVRPLPEGGRFDPAVHACVAREESIDREPGEILATLRRGFTIDGRILRPAQVRVAGKTAAAEPMPEASEPGASEVAERESD
jgi:molecular chaperone GrpE